HPPPKPTLFPYTTLFRSVNERYAAYDESYRRESEWRQLVVGQAMEEYSRTGDAKNFFEEVLSHYEGLPAIEQAQYPANYAQDLRSEEHTSELQSRGHLVC